VAPPKLQHSSGNSASTTSSSSISDSDTSLPLASDTNFSVKSGEGMVIINEGTASEELAYATGKSGSSLTIPLANRGLEGTAAAGHASGTSVKGILTAGMWNDAIDTIKAEHNDDGTHSDITADSLDVGDLTVTGTVTGIDQIFTTTSYAPEGFLLNGKIVPSVTSNNLTVAIKTLAGTDPSATDPVYVRLGDTVRSITSALGFTTNAGNNFLAMGSAELATKEVDLFVYLGWNTDSSGNIMLAFSRIPYATKKDSFVQSTTDVKGYIATGGANSSDNDVFQVVGRFAATLSAGAGYTWTVPTFTSANLIQRPIYETRPLTYATTNVGFSSMAANSTQYRISGISCRLAYYMVGASNSATFTSTLPIAPVFNTTDARNTTVVVHDNSAWQAGTGVIALFNNDSVIRVGKTIGTIAGNAYAGFTTSNNKGSSFSIEYPIA